MSATSSTDPAVGRPYDEGRDLAAVTRMWREAGWIDDSEGQAEGLRAFLSVGSTSLADVDGAAECMVHRTSGTFRHRRTDLAMSAITGVITSHVGRRQGLASALMAESLAAARNEGAVVSVLGMFEQGFYDRFGFGTGPYEHQLRFDPSSLLVDTPVRPPVRIGPDDWRDVHALLVRRHRGHGSIVLDPPEILRAELAWVEHPVGLGFRADDGRLTHFVLGSAEHEHGPFHIGWIGYEDPVQLLELLGLLRSLGDQYDTVVLDVEPPEVQLQDLLRGPIRQRRLVGPGANGAVAEMQLRILDLDACVEAVRVDRPLAFGLRLRDPLADDVTVPWPGVGGDFTVRLGDRSELVAGLGAGTLVLDASVNAFSRLWAGARPASSLALTDELDGPPELLEALDDVLRLPPPRDTWSF